jgi:uncharacterized protein YceH (UPF0502 family)
MVLDPVQVRVLGALIEKEITTPENYPLSLNALLNACNQRSSREPVMELTEDDLRQALHTLEDDDLVSSLHDARVPKYEHQVRTVWNLRRDETAALCLLMLRGPQTAGEIRGRSERLHAFDDIASAQSTLDRLATREPASDGTPNGTGPLTVLLPRQPGSREARYAHLLSGQPEFSGETANASVASHPAPPSRIAELEERIAALASALEDRITRMESSHQR